MSLDRGFRRLFRIGRYADRVERELDEELDFHFHETVEELMSRGMEREDAEREARRRFGDEERHRERIRAVERTHRRRERGAAPWSALRDDLASAWRSVVRTPGFAAAVVVMLALGIGANATVFRLVDRLLLSSPDHVERPEEVRRVFGSSIQFNGRLWTSPWLTYPDYRDFTSVDAFREVAAYSSVTRTLGSGPEAQEVRAVRATASLFPLLGVRPALGRFFTEDEDGVGAAEPTAVLGHGLWERRFGADPGVLGRTIDIGRARYTIVGIAPEGFTGVDLAPVDIWLPLHVDQAAQTGGDVWSRTRDWTWLHVVARLAPGIGVEAAEAEATAAHRAGWAAGEERTPEEFDPEAEIVTASLIAADEPQVSRAGVEAAEGGGSARVEAATVAGWLAGVSLIVLLIACANVANLLLARGIRRRRELAVRVALGISRRRLVSQLLTESLLLGVLGAAAALLIVYAGGPLVTGALLPDVEFAGILAPRLLGFTGMVALVSVVLAGLVPAWRATRTDVESSLRGGGRGSSLRRSRTRRGLLLAQVGLSVVLLVGAGVFVRSMEEVARIDLGLEPDGLLVVELETTGRLDDAQSRDLFARAEERIEALPSVRRAASSEGLHFRSTMGRALGVPGLDSLPRIPSGGPYVYAVSAGFFETMGLAILRGRGIEPADDREGVVPVVVVNETMARLVWPDRDAVGRCMYVGREAREERRCSTVVGVVEDSRRQDVVGEEPQMLYYVPVTAAGFAPWNLVVRHRGTDAGRAMEEVRSSLGTLDPAVRRVGIQPFRHLYQDQLRGWRLGATMFTAFGLLALLVAGLGLYSSLAFEVAQRRRELGIRSALGADTLRLVRTVVRDNLVVVSGGMIGGVLLALGLSGRIEPLLYGVSPRDPAVYLTVVAALLLVAAVAAVVPAARATRVDPREALQAE